MKFYLGSRYSRLEEMRGYAEALQGLGHTVTSQWLTGEYGDLVGATSNPSGDPAACEAAQHDTADILAADVVIIFTDHPGYQSKNGRGGFHVEFGVALGRHLMGANVRMILVGHRVNSFHHLPAVEFFATWNELFRELSHHV